MKRSFTNRFFTVFNVWNTLTDVSIFVSHVDINSFDKNLVNLQDNFNEKSRSISFLPVSYKCGVTDFLVSFVAHDTICLGLSRSEEPECDSKRKGTMEPMSRRKILIIINYSSFSSDFFKLSNWWTESLHYEIVNSSFYANVTKLTMFMCDNIYQIIHKFDILNTL